MKIPIPLLALAVLVCAGPASAQRVAFDFEEHLPGFFDVFDTAYEQFYALGPFLELEGESLTKDELAGWQRRWEAAKAAGDARVAELAADPQEYFAFHLERRLKRHVYFRDRLKRKEFVRVDDFAPFLLYVQTEEDSPADLPQKMAAVYGPMLQKLEQDFRYQYASLEGLERKEGHEAYALFVLLDRDLYLAYGKAHDGDNRLARAHYDADFKIGVTYNDPENRDIHAALHEMVHAMEHAYHAEEIDAAEEARQGLYGLGIPPWVGEGFAEYLAYKVGRDEKDPKVPRDSVLRLAMAVERNPDFAHFIHPLERLAGIKSYADAEQVNYDIAREKKIVEPGLPATLSLFYPQSDLFMHYLFGHYNGEIRDYIGRLLKGEEQPDAFRGAFGSIDLPKLDEGFLDFLKENGASDKAIDLIRAARS